MKLILTFLLFSVLAAKAQDTFSIVAIDSVTGEIGSAGASCVTSSGVYPHGVQIICDVIAGVGAINTQAAWNFTNRLTAHNRMVAGDSAQAIIDYVTSHDVQGNSSTR